MQRRGAVGRAEDRPSCQVAIALADVIDAGGVAYVLDMVGDTCHRDHGYGLLSEVISLEGRSLLQGALLLVGPLCAILGVIVGGFLGARGQIRQQAFVYYLAIEKSREDACVQLLSAVRQFRRYVMYSDVTTEVVAASDQVRTQTY